MSGKKCEKVTGSRLRTFLGIFDKSKFEDYWKIVLAGLTKKEIRNFLNFWRGQQYQSEALAYFNEEA